MSEKAYIEKKPQSLKTFYRFVFFSALGILAILSIPLYVKYSVRNKIFTNCNNLQRKEFAIVLGAGIKARGKPGFYLKQRLNDVVTLYKTGKVKKILLTGDNGSKKHNEISVMNNYLVKKGVPQKIIFGDYAGFDTYSSMERADKIFDIKEAVIVSQGFHLPRSVFIARYKGIDAIGYTTNYNTGKKKYFIREWAATIKSFFDSISRRQSKFYGRKVNTNGSSNIKKG